MSTLPAPVNVSPLIRFGRWSFLAVGVLYGAVHQRRLSKKEAAFQEVESKRKAIRDAKIAAEKKIISDRELKELEELVGIK